MKKKIIGTLVLLVLLSAAVPFLVLSYSYSEGNRVGKLVKLSRKGFFPKTWEGTLDLGSGDRLTWDFSVHDAELAEKLQEETGRVVNLGYRKLLWRVFYKTEYDIISWSLSNKVANDENLFCRFVAVLRKSKIIVGQIRPLIEKYDPQLLNNIRDCQNKVIEQQKK